MKSLAVDALITGPNMGGKSTYLRHGGAAGGDGAVRMLCAGGADAAGAGGPDLYADRGERQRGAGAVDVHGGDDGDGGDSEYGDGEALVLLDEMGRGTATYDGLSLAWATVEHLHDRIGARTLFATHYHELTLLAERLTRLKNLRVTVKETAGGIVFLHTVEAGAASKSYGIEVARLAGLAGGR